MGKSASPSTFEFAAPSINSLELSTFDNKDSNLIIGGKIKSMSNYSLSFPRFESILSKVFDKSKFEIKPQNSKLESDAELSKIVN